MNAKEIRENCHKCGNRSLMLIDPAPLPTDYCDAADLDCGMILFCDPSMRIPKTKQVKYKRAVKDV